MTKKKQYKILLHFLKYSLGSTFHVCDYSTIVYLTILHYMNVLFLEIEEKETLKRSFDELIQII